MQILIIEDEFRAARQLQGLLEKSGLVYTVLDIIDSVEDAVNWFKSNHSVDLVFMDVQLADGLSFEIFQKVDVQTPIIFTTAFDQYAIQAFKVNSIDYLLKPIKEVDFNIAIDQYQKASASNAIPSDILQQLIVGMKKPKERSGILVKEGSGFVQIKIEDIFYFYSEDSMTFAVSKDKRYVVEETMDQLFGSLSSDRFFRINRGQIISKGAVEKIEPYFNHRVKLLVLSDRGMEFVVSRGKSSGFKAWMNR